MEKHLIEKWYKWVYTKVHLLYYYTMDHQGLLYPASRAITLAIHPLKLFIASCKFQSPSYFAAKP